MARQTDTADSSARLWPGEPADLCGLRDLDFDEAQANLSAAREHHPWGVGELGPILLRHGDATALLHSSDFEQLGMGLLEFNGVTDGLLHKWWSQIMFANEGARHQRLRESVRGWLTPNRVAGLADPVRDDVRAIISELPSGEPFDLAARIADPIPIAAICALLGVDTDRVGELGSATTDVGLAFGMFNADEHRRIVAALEVLLEWGSEALAHSRPGTLARSIADAADNGDLERPEAISLIANLLFAAHDTTRFLISNAFWLLGRNPGVWEQLVAGRVAGSAVAEETARFAPPVIGTQRIATSEASIGDLVVGPGSVVGVSLWSAGRDSHVYEDPDLFDPSRPAAPILSFGHGVHHCIGAPLARLEASVVLDTVAAECPDLLIDSAGAHHRIGTSAITGVESLPARLP